jgi:hypothetical protein
MNSSDRGFKINPFFPFPSAETWITNNNRNPDRILRKADDLYVPAHRVEFVKRLPLFSFLGEWKTAPGNRVNPRQHQCKKELNNILLSSL